ncbi:hypothetical protein ACFL10_01015 [Patescibacteria group bacterium]
MTDSEKVIPKQFFFDQVSHVTRLAKEVVDAKKDKYLSNVDILKRTIDGIADKIKGEIRRVIKGKGITDKTQLDTLCNKVRGKLKQDNSLLQFNATEIIDAIDEGLEDAARELNEKYAKVLAKLPEGEPANQREAFFEELAAYGVEEKNAFDGIMAKLNSILLGFSPEFFDGVKQFNFNEQLSAAQIREIKQLFNTVSGEIKANIKGHISDNPQLSFEVLKKNILDALEQFNFIPQELPKEVVEIFEAVIINDFKRYIDRTTESLKDLWNLTTDSREETISCDEIQEQLCQYKLAYSKNEDEEKEPYALTAEEEKFILRLYLSMDKGFEAQTHQERVEAIAAQSNDQNHGGLDIRTAEDVDKLLDSIPSYGSETVEEIKTSPIFELMKRVDGAAKPPREIGQALIRLREGLAKKAKHFHQLRVPSAIEVNRLNQEIADIRGEIEEIENIITESVEQLTAQHEQIDMVSELVVLRARTETKTEDHQLRNQAEQLEQYLQTIKRVQEELEKIQKLEEAINQIQSSLQEINNNIDEGELYLRSTLREETFGADPKAILGDEYKHIFDYTPDRDLDIKLGTIETACGQCTAKIEELKKIKIGQIFEITEQVVTAFVIVKEQLDENVPEELIDIPIPTAIEAQPESIREPANEETSPENTKFTSIQLHSLLFSTAIGAKNRIWGIELDTLYKLLIELDHMEITDLQSLVDEISTLSDIDDSFTDESKLRKNRPKKEERAASEELFIIWKDKKSAIYVLPTHKGYNEVEKLPEDLRLDDDQISKIRKKVKSIRNNQQLS